MMMNRMMVMMMMKCILGLMMMMMMMMRVKMRMMMVAFLSEASMLDVRRALEPSCFQSFMLAGTSEPRVNQVCHATEAVARKCNNPSFVQQAQTEMMDVKYCHFLKLLG
jgi:hypothetical protein